MNCPFCDSTIIERQTFFESDFVYAMCTHRPILPGHFLIIPKRHVERFELLSDEELIEIKSTINKKRS